MLSKRLCSNIRPPTLVIPFLYYCIKFVSIASHFLAKVTSLNSCIPPPAGARSGNLAPSSHSNTFLLKALENCQTKHNWTIFSNTSIAKEWDSFVVKKM